MNTFGMTRRDDGLFYRALPTCDIGITGAHWPHCCRIRLPSLRHRCRESIGYQAICLRGIDDGEYGATAPRRYTLFNGKEKVTAVSECHVMASRLHCCVTAVMVNNIPLRHGIRRHWFG